MSGSVTRSVRGIAAATLSAACLVVANGTHVHWVNRTGGIGRATAAGKRVQKNFLPNAGAPAKTVIGRLAGGITSVAVG
jgi:hypothetical protein